MDCVDSPQSPTQEQVARSCLKSQREEERLLLLLFFLSFTLFTVGSFVARVAHTVACQAVSVSPALRVDTLGGGNVTLGALPAAVALAAPPGVLAVPAAQNRAGG